MDASELFSYENEGIRLTYKVEIDDFAKQFSTRYAIAGDKYNAELLKHLDKFTSLLDTSDLAIVWHGPVHAKVDSEGTIFYYLDKTMGWVWASKELPEISAIDDMTMGQIMNHAMEFTKLVQEINKNLIDEMNA